MMLLKELLTLLPAAKVTGSPEVEIVSLTSDSRKAERGSLFVAVKGHTFDGHDFIPDVIKRGASVVVMERGYPVPDASGITVVQVRDTRRALAILADRFYDHPSHKLRLIGVTGTNGKTTTTHLLHKILTDHGFKTGLIGTIHTLIGDQRLTASNTTPESADLHRYLAEMVEQGCSYAVMEVSSHAIDMGRIRGARFKSAIFTNLTQDHLDYHESMEEYKRVKGTYFSLMGNDYGGEVRPVILNADDPASSYYARVTSAPVITYGIENDADVRATRVEVSGEGLRFYLETWMGAREVQLRLMGRFNVYNALAAIAAALLEGLPLDSVIESLSSLTSGASGRFERVEEGQEFAVIVDYAHTPDGLENVLSTARQFAKGKVICVVGCGGDRDRGKRPVMAKIAAELSDYSILTSDNPRSEDPLQILSDMEAGIRESYTCGKDYEVVVDRREAIFKAIGMARAGDCVLIAGKGHETYQILGNQTIHFDDREVAREAIRSRNRA